MLKDTEQKYNVLLERIIDGLDIPEYKYKQAVDRYKSLSKYLKEKIKKDVEIYPQGSMRLGTVVRPLKNGKDADYDVDLVCELQINKDETTAKRLKQDIGKALEDNGYYKSKLDKEGKRCWTLNYDEDDKIGFHVDVLPCIPQNILSPATSLEITHKNTDNDYKWMYSNPKAYAEWFDNRKKPAFDRIVNEQKRSILEKNLAFYNSIEEIPDFRVKTPLQRVIQILKRHRDFYFNGMPNEKYKPISIIITTLSTHLYEQESDTYTALHNIVLKLQEHSGLLGLGRIVNENLAQRQLITRVYGEWKILNPVEPTENFADKWHLDDNARAKAFFEWVSKIREDLIDDFGNLYKNENRDKFAKMFSEKVIQQHLKEIELVAPMQTNEQNIQPYRTTLGNTVEPEKPWSN